MVNRNVLKKLSDFELENYLKEGNYFIPEAVQMAFEILEERGRIFTEQEKNAVQQLIRSKKEAEEAKLTKEKELWKDYITEDPNAIELYSRELILIMSIILGTIPSSILLGLNFIKLKKYAPAILTFIFGFIFLPIQNFVVHFLYHNTQHIFTYKRKSPEFFMTATGALILLVFWIVFTPKKLSYRASSYIFPFVISVIMLALITTNYQGWFSSYILVSFAK